MIYYLEKYEKFDVEFEFIWNAHKIKKKDPDLVILPNTRGHGLYYELALYCRENDVLVYCHDSEGNFSTDNKDYNYWAYNLIQDTVCPIHFTWNNRIKDFLENKYNIPSERLVVSGAPGFDKYQYLAYKTKKEILGNYNLGHFSKVVGYAGWAFGKLYNKEINDVLNFLKMPGELGKKWLIEQRDAVESALKHAIEANPDVLFLLKKHPRENFESDMRDSRNEMNQLKEYPNVLYLKDEEEIQDLIHISDLWIAFESTSIMEAWLLGKPTLMINPVSDFNRSDIFKGSVIAKNENDVLMAIEALYSENLHDYFNPQDVLSERHNIISNSIGFADGMNHLRCAKAFQPYLTEIKPRKKRIKLHPKFFRFYLLLHIGKWFYVRGIFKRLPKFKKTVWIFENYKLEKVKKGKQINFTLLDKFYGENNLPQRIESGEIWREL
jgi:surface carbohydrate biosynthesis protein